MNRIGIIGGTGLLDFQFSQNLAEKYKLHQTRDDYVTAETDYGEVPLRCITVKHSSTEKEKHLIFLQRHHNAGKVNKPPHMINHKANISALEMSRCDVIISVCSVGSLVNDFPPGKVALADQYIDFSGIATSFSDEFATFTSVTEPFCYDLNKKLESILRKSQGFFETEQRMYYTYWLAQGPHFETRAEVNAIEQLGGDMVGMTMPREVKLANEVKIPYSAICISSNWAAGREPGNPTAELSHESVSEQANERLQPVFECIFSLLGNEQ